jgi:hypothetical protein
VWLTTFEAALAIAEHHETRRPLSEPRRAVRPM